MISKVNSGIMTGINNLAQYSSATNASISSMMSALTQLQNSLATAFAPILSVVAPILTAFTNMLSKAITYVGMFIAALTGQKSFTRAKAVQEDYAASLNKTSSGANKAAKATKNNAKATKKANKEIQTYLSGLDEVRQYQKEKDNDTPSSSTPSAGGGGGGGGYTGPSIGDMFEKVPIESSIADIAKKIKSVNNCINTCTYSTSHQIPIYVIYKTIERPCKCVYKISYLWAYIIPVDRIINLL